METPTDESLSVTVVITNFNKGRLLLRALGSVKNQIEAPKELVIVDDCSDDQETLKTLQRLPETDVPLIMIQHPARAGASGAVNSGVFSATSEIIMLLDADDELTPNAVRDVRKAFLETPEADIIYGNVIRIADRGATQILMSGAAFSFENGRANLRQLAQSWELHGTSPFKRSMFVDSGGQDSLHPRTNDSDFFRKNLAAGRIARHLDRTIYVTYLDDAENSRGIDPLDLSASWFRNLDFYMAALGRREFVLMFAKKTLLLLARLINTNSFRR